MNNSVPLSSTSRKEWLVLKDEYLTLQKKSMKSLKKCINQIHHQAPKKVVETKDDPKEEHGELVSDGLTARAVYLHVSCSSLKPLL